MLDEIHLILPFLGSRRLVDELKQLSFEVNRKRLLRLMRVMGLSPIYPRPRTTRSGSGAGHKIYSYLFRDLDITHSNHVWSTDI